MTKIEWTEKTWNPIAGCSKVSLGCGHCYAETMAKRLSAMGQEKYKATIDEHGRWNGNIVLDQKALYEPLNRKKPTMYFVNSMSDLFHENVDGEWINYIFTVMAIAKQHTFQILTKRPERMQSYFETFDPDYIYDNWYSYSGESPEIQAWPLPNVWLGVSTENQEQADKRIPLLMRTPAKVRFLSCEPLLGPIDFKQTIFTPNYPKVGHNKDIFPWFDWVIVGGESGHNARKMNRYWVTAIRDFCQEHQIPFFFKQWGEYDHDGQRVGKKNADRWLDGRKWDEMPHAVCT